MIDCNEWRTEKRHEFANMGKVKRLELWWQLYRTSLPVRDLENFRPMDFCSTVYIWQWQTPFTIRFLTKSFNNLYISEKIKTTKGMRDYSLFKCYMKMNMTRKICEKSQILHSYIIYNKPTRCNSGSIVFINNYKYALHLSDVLCVHHQEHYKL